MGQSGPLHLLFKALLFCIMINGDAVVEAQEFRDGELEVEYGSRVSRLAQDG